MYYYIVNPAAGGGAITSIQDRLKATLHELKIDGEFAKTLGPGDASKVAATALDRGAKTLVAVGGGKTVNEIINTVYKQKKSDVAVGIIPIGKHNTLARSLGINNWREACEILASRRLVEYSLVAVNEYVLVHSLVVMPAQSTADEDEESTPSPTLWKRLLATRPASKPNQVINFKADFDQKLRVRGQTPRIEIYNQKFWYPELDNGLLVQIHEVDSVDKTGLLARLSPQLDKPNKQYSQLHCRQLRLKTEQLCSGSLDEKQIDSRQFDISLTDWKLRLITNLPR